MAHINSIGAGLFSDLAVCVENVTAAIAAYTTAAEFQGLFGIELAVGSASSATPGEFRRITNIREFPAIGTPPNIVNVPVFGQKSSSQVQGQSDSPSMEITVNFIGTDWQDTANYLGELVGDGTQRVFRFTLMNSEPTGTTANTKYASTVGGIGSTQNSQYYWFGKIEALVVNPQLTDANTATITLTIQSAIMGAFTI
jgi:hypothetical protein